tara:strand:+ start:72 stop:260 length:189 start_codon:yes stop_codon:yes gene_type:complete
MPNIQCTDCTVGGIVMTHTEHDLYIKQQRNDMLIIRCEQCSLELEKTVEEINNNWQSYKEVK